jgi:hypothetical protein
MVIGYRYGLEGGKNTIPDETEIVPINGQRIYTTGSKVDSTVDYRKEEMNYPKASTGGLPQTDPSRADMPQSHTDGVYYALKSASRWSASAGLSLSLFLSSQEKHKCNRQPRPSHQRNIADLPFPIRRG